MKNGIRVGNLGAGRQPVAKFRFPARLGNGRAHSEAPSGEASTSGSHQATLDDMFHWILGRRRYPENLYADGIERLIAKGEDVGAALRASKTVHVEMAPPPLTRKMIEAFAFTKDSKTLGMIKISFCNLGDRDARALAEGLPAGLFMLDLRVNNIGPEGAKWLAGGLPMGLKTLVLGSNSIGDDGAVALGARLPRGLQYLDLQDNSIGDKGLRGLAEGLPKGLTNLQLGGNSFGYEGVVALAPKLTWRMYNLYLGLPWKVEESLLAWLGKEPLPVDDALLRLFQRDYLRARAREILERNRRRVATLQGLHTWPGDFVMARNVRVLFCGNEKVGKTSLRRSVRCRRQQSFEDLTRGIEVEYFEDEGLDFSLWDMGGQQEFHILHSYLMPDLSFTSHKATLFVLVLKVAETSTSSLEAVRYWFKLIASTTAPGKTRQVMVILNRWDGEKWGKEVEEYRTELKTLGDLHRTSIVLWDVRDIDVRQGDAARAMWQAIIDLRSNSVAEVEIVPSICQQVVDRLPGWRAERCERVGMPVMDKIMFEQQIQDMVNRDPVVEKMGGVPAYGTFCKSLVHYLQDSGQIVHFGSEGDWERGGWVVLDTSWLGHDVVGQLLGLRLNAKADGIRCSDGMAVAAHIAEFFKSKGYNWDLVKRLLIEMNLCYDVPGTQERPMLFVPALFEVERTGSLFKEWSSGDTWDERHLVGIRVKCSQEKQFMLGSPFFWRLQSMIANNLKPQNLVNCLRLSSYSRNGVDIIVTYEEEQDELHIFATQVFGTPTPNVVLRQLGICSAFVTEAALKDRIGVATYKSVLHPICLQNLGQGITERDLDWWEPIDLHNRLLQDGEEATLGCNPCATKSKHAVLIKHIAELSQGGMLPETSFESGVPLVERVWCLFEPKGSVEFDVVFFSGPRTAWSTRDGSVSCWPKEWLPEALPRARVLEVKFPRHLSLWESAINDAQALTMRDVKLGSRPYFLVGHSIGGILATEFLLRADRTYEELGAKCKGIVFYGVPQLDELPVKSGLFGISESEMCQFNPNESLKRYVDFQPLRSEFPTHCFLESMETTIGDRKLMVSKHSAAVGAKASNLTFVGGADHFQVCRPQTKDDLTVKMLIDFIESRRQSGN